MKKYSLVSNYTIAQYKVGKSKCNEDKIANVVDREFDNRERLEVVVSDLTYIRVSNKWCYNGVIYVHYLIYTIKKL